MIPKPAVEMTPKYRRCGAATQRSAPFPGRSNDRPSNVFVLFKLLQRRKLLRQGTAALREEARLKQS